MHSSIRVARRVAAAFVVVFQFASVPTSLASIGPAAVRCQQAISAGGGAFVVRQVAELGRCATAILTCVEAEPPDDACLAATTERCARAIAHVTRRQAALARIVAGRCAGVEADALVAPDGLGFAALAAVCPALGNGHGGADVIGACVAGLQRCEGERLLAALVPRAGELVRIAGLPASQRAVLACLPDHGGSGRGDGEGGTVVAECARRTGRAAKRLAARTVASVAACTRVTLPCLDARAGAACVDDARAVCDRAFARLDGTRRGFDRMLATACGPDRVPFATLAAPAGANLRALADDCAAVEVAAIPTFAAYARCLARRQECALAAVARNAMPRVDAALALVDRTLAGAFCPVPDSGPTRTATPTPTPVPTITPTATSTGPTPTPRPGETATPTPQPTATPVCGDGEVDGDEQCDGGNLEDNECDDLCEDASPRGVLACHLDCTFDFDGCGPNAGCEAP